MVNVLKRGCTVLVAFGWLALGACASPSAPTAVPAGGGESSQSSVQAESVGLAASAGERQVTDLTLAKAGWICIQPGNGLTLCGAPGLGVPPIPPAAQGQPRYNLMAFTAEHEFVHKVELLRPDLYHGEPCLGGDPWTYLDFLDYYECLIPGS